MKALLGITWLLVISGYASVVYDPTMDFSPTDNPFGGVWSAGYTVGLGGSFSLDNIYFETGGFGIWYNGGVTPSVQKNFSGNTLYNIPPGFINMHPTTEAYSVLRFIAPNNARFTISGHFYTGDAGDTDAYILQNNNTETPLFYSESTSSDPGFYIAVNLHAGDFIDFLVGSKGDMGSDSTPFDGIITGEGEVIPEPGSFALMVIGGFFARVLVRRYRRMPLAEMG